MLKRGLFITVALFMGVLFFAGVAKLCLLRFSRGDVYPPLSSLRTDPLGVKACYDALAETGLHEVRRNYRPLYKLEAEPSSTFFYLGAKLDARTEDWDDLWQLAYSGKRVVIAFAPTTVALSETKYAKATPAPSATPSKTGTKKDEQEQSQDETQFDANRISWSDALKKAGVILHTEKEWENAELKARASSNKEAAADPVLSWHSVAWLETSGTTFQTLYLCSKKPVIVERPVGKGSLILATDSFFITNEALWTERAPHLLASVIGNNREIVFDESHLNSIEQLGVSTLIRQYRMEGVFIVFALLAALYVWKNAMPLLPRSFETTQTGDASPMVAGRDTTAGFVNLLRRSIPENRIIATCIEEWNNAFGHLRGQCPQPGPESSASPVEQFSDLAKTLSSKKR